MTRITHGIMRTVYLTRRYAIKIPSPRFGWRMFIRGLSANLGEREYWRRWEGDTSFVVEDRTYSGMLCPVLWSSWGGWVIVMPRVEILTEEEYREDVGGPVLTAFHDSKADNFGWLDGRVVCVDYGGEG